MNKKFLLLASTLLAMILITLPTLAYQSDDLDHDGLSDQWEIMFFGGIETYNATDDPDNDGCNNGCEFLRGINPVNSDTDGDGLSDGYEVYVHATNPSNPDTDADYLEDGWELNYHPLTLYPDDINNPLNPLMKDTDGDGVDDNEEVSTLYHDPARGATDTFTSDPHNNDTDGDGLMDGEEFIIVPPTNPRLDFDGDALTDDWEIAHFGNIDEQDGLSDQDNDGCHNLCEMWRLIDPFDEDTDQDGLWDGEEVYTYQTSPLKADTDGDYVNDNEEIDYTTGSLLQPGDVSSPLNPLLKDTDGDGVNDNEELFTIYDSPLRFATDFYTSDPNRIDTDNDSVTDGEEFLAATNPRSLDTDNDGLSDDEEINLYLTDPLSPDTDLDRLLDGQEVLGFEFSGNLIMTDPLQPDTDGDGLYDGDEVLAPAFGDTTPITDPCNVQNYASNPTLVDSDSDNLDDFMEVCGFAMTLRKGNPTPSEYIIHTDPLEEDTDLDGLADNQEYQGIFVPPSNQFKSDPTHVDTDGGTVSDGDEIINGTNPDDHMDDIIFDVDQDDDSMDDCWEASYIAEPPVDCGSIDYDVLANEWLPHNDHDIDNCDNLCEHNYGGNPWIVDTDADGLTDGEEIVLLTRLWDSDTDDDMLLDGQEVHGVQVTFPDNTNAVYTSNPRTVHTDGDGLTDYDEIVVHLTNPKLVDTDSDTLTDHAEITGFNITVMGQILTVYPKPYWADTDTDGLNDSVELMGVSVMSTNNTPMTVFTDPTVADTDADTLNDGQEANGFPLTLVVDSVTSNVTIRIDPTKVDTDMDGLADNVETTSNPKTTPANSDTDSDTLTDGQEINGVNVTLPDNQSVTYTSNPTLTDTDADTLTDGAEVNTHLTNPKMLDTDGDSYSDALEIASGSNPLDPDSKPSTPTFTPLPPTSTVTSIPPTETFTATATPVPPTMTNTPESPTATPEPSTMELPLLNPGFEIAGSPAAGWQGINLRQDKRKCNVDGKPPIAHSGECAFRFTGTSGILSSITQSVTVTDSAAGDTLTLSVWVKGKSISTGGKIQALITFEDNTKTKISIPVTPGKYAYTERVKSKAMSGKITSLRVRVSMNGGSGAFFVDDLKLMLTRNQ